MKYNDSVSKALEVVESLSLQEIDDAIEYHQNRLDSLRLLRQVVEQRMEDVRLPVVVHPAAKPKPVEVYDASLEEEKVEEPKPEPPPPQPVEDPNKLSKEERLLAMGITAREAYDYLLKNDISRISEIACGINCPSGRIDYHLKRWQGTFFQLVGKRWQAIPQRDNTPVDRGESLELARKLADPPKANPRRFTNGENAASDLATVKWYLQINQPAKPVLIAKEVGLSLDVVLRVLEQNRDVFCHEENGRGWLLVAEKEAADEGVSSGVLSRGVV